MSTAIFSIFPFFFPPFFPHLPRLQPPLPRSLISFPFSSPFLFHIRIRRRTKRQRSWSAQSLRNASLYVTAIRLQIYIYICPSFSLSLGGHSTKVRHCHATTLFESSRARTGEKAKKEELVRLSVCLVIIVGSESWWILVPRVLFVYPYTMRHGKYFDETFFSFYRAIGIVLLRGGYTRFRNRWHVMMKVYFAVAYYLSSTYWLVLEPSRDEREYFNVLVCVAK